MPEHMHRYDWSAPRGGWPSFGPDGKRIREHDVEPVRCPTCGETVASAPPGAEVTGTPGEVSIDGVVVHTCEPPAE